MLPALHGGATAGFLETTAIIELAWAALWEDMEQGRLDPTTLHPTHLPRLPKTIRAEIDASLNAEAFEQMARQDPAEFTHRYGDQVLEILQKQGVNAISRIGDFAPLKSEHGVH